MDWSPYCGSGAVPSDLWQRWNLDPPLLAALFAGVFALTTWRRSWKLPAVALGVLLVAFVSPLCALSSALFTARTIHHVLLVGIAAPLLAWSLPRAGPSGLGASLVAHAAVFWTWHAPGLYAWALISDGAYWLMQLTLLGSALWFWVSIRASSIPLAVAGLLVATVQMGLLGALLTFAVRPFYAPHLETTLAWSLTPLEDQQAAGLIMWAPAAGIYLACAVVLLGRSFGRATGVEPARA